MAFICSCRLLGARGPFGFDRFAEFRQHHLFETIEIVARDRLARRDGDLAAIGHGQNAAAHGAEALAIVAVVPTHDRHRERRQQSAWPLRMPKLPLSSSARTAITSESSTTTLVGVVMSKSHDGCASRLAEAFFCARLVDGADHVERALRPLVAGAVENCPAALERLGQRYRSSGLAGEGLGDRERLRQEPLQAGAPA